MASASHALVTSAEFVRQFGRWQDHAATQPIVVTHHGRRRLIVLSTGHYQDLVGGGEGAPPTLPSEPQADIETLTEHIAQGFVAFGPDMVVTAINRSACAFLKVTRSAVVGRTLVDWLPGIEESLGYANLSRAAASGSIATLEMPSFAYPGRWLLFQTFPYAGGAACMFRDITDELEARRRVDSRAATLAALAAHGGVGRARLSPRGTFAEIDAAFAGFAGFTPEGLAGARLTDILRPRSRVAAGERIEQVLNGGGPVVLAAHLLARDGSERPVRIAVAPLREYNAPAGAVAVMTPRGEGEDGGESESL